MRRQVVIWSGAIAWALIAEQVGGQSVQLRIPVMIQAWRGGFSLETSPEEAELVDRLLKLVPDADRARVLRNLADPGISGMGRLNAPQFAVLFDSLLQFRRKRDSANRLIQVPLRHRQLEVTVVLLDSLRDSTAVAVVVRRPGYDPQDVIAISAPKASAAALRNAVQELWRLRLIGGTDAKEPEVSVIHQAQYNTVWLGEQWEYDRSALTSLLYSDRRTVDGVGWGRVMNVLLVSNWPPFR